MSGLQTLEPSVEPVPTTAAKPQWRFSWRLLVAPLLGISVVLHIGLLFVPLPAWDSVADPEEEAPPEEEEATEVISLNDIPGTPETAEPPPPTEQPQQPRPTRPSTGAPPRPDQIPEDFAASEDGEEQDQSLAPEDLPPEGPLSFDPDRQRSLLDTAQGNLSSSAFGGINGNPALVATAIANGWHDNLDQSCFFASLEGQPQVVAGAINAMFFTRGLDRVRDTELPRVIAGEFIHQGDYCGAELYEVREGGVPILFVSLIGIGEGNPPATAAAVIWAADPRL